MITDTPRAGERIVENDIATDQFQSLLEQLERQVNLNTPIIGAGSPEGVVTAEPYQVYLDSSGSPGSLEYRKMTGTGNTGWVLV
jgi:hypothetical protein